MVSFCINLHLAKAEFMHRGYGGLKGGMQVLGNTEIEAWDRRFYLQDGYRK